MASGYVRMMGKFGWQNLPAHLEPENVLKAQFMEEFKKPSESSRTIATLQLPSTGHGDFINHLKARVQYYQRKYEKEKNSK